MPMKKSDMEYNKNLQFSLNLDNALVLPLFINISGAKKDLVTLPMSCKKTAKKMYPRTFKDHSYEAYKSVESCETFFLSDQIFEFNSQEIGKLSYKCDYHCTIQSESNTKKRPIYFKPLS